MGAIAVMSSENPETGQSAFQIGHWRVEPANNQLRSNGESRQLEPRMMDLLVYLADHAGETVSKEDIFAAVWAETFVTDSALWRCISELRQILEKDPADPPLIVTVPQRGYRLTGSVDFLTVESGANATPHPQMPIRRPLVAGIAGVLLIGALLAGWAWFQNVESTGPALAGSDQDRPTLLLARLDNRTGEELLDGTLEVVLEGRLNDSGRLKLVSRPRVEDSLELMRKPAATRLTEAVALQVSQRDGAVDYVLAGQVDSLGARYHVTLRLLDGRSRELVASNDLATDSLKGLLPLADEQSSWVLSQLKIAEVPLQNRPEQVTTRSLKALKLYTRGLAKYSGSIQPNPNQAQSNAQAAHLFEEAIQIDPQFASAHLMLAWSWLGLDRSDPKHAEKFGGLIPASSGKGRKATRPTWDALKRAMEMREYASLVERYFIQACYHDWRGENQEAASFYRLIIDTQPEHRWAANNLWIMGSLERDLAMFSEGLMAQSLRYPNYPPLFSMVQLGDLEAARILRDRFERSLERDSHPSLGMTPFGKAYDRRHRVTADVWAFEIWSLWYQGKYGEVEASLARLVESVASLHAEGIDVANSGYAFWLGTLQAMLGKLADARLTQRVYKLEPQSGNIGGFVSPPAVHLALLEESPVPLGKPMVNSLRWGLVLDLIFTKMFFDRPFAHSYQIAESPHLSERRSVTRFISTLKARDPETRIEGLRAFLEAVSFNNQRGVLFFAIRWGLARELALQGRDEEAVTTLEKLVADRNRAFGRTVVWQKAVFDLGRSYQRLGRFEEAQPLLEELHQMLQFADSDHPILRQLNRDLAKTTELPSEDAIPTQPGS